MLNRTGMIGPNSSLNAGMLQAALHFGLHLGLLPLTEYCRDSYFPHDVYTLFFF